MPMPRRSSRPATIYACAQTGNLSALQEMLHENPDRLNARSIMMQTPLHVAAAYNKIRVVEYLLEWEGPEKLKLEAKNMYGETPLHMAAKNGCSEAAKMLLEHGAMLEAKTYNGMTALHLSVLHANIAKECNAVRTLLKHNADYTAKDNKEKTPLDHLSQDGPCREEVQELFNQHIDMQGKHKALESCGEATAKMAEFESALSNIVGLEELKLQLLRWARGMIFDEKRRAFGLNIATRMPPHMAFLGSPGTGKSMVAQVLGKLLHMVGILPTDKVTEVQRTDLVGEFVGHTGPKTRRKIKEAEGGVLFVDEAYRLIPTQKADDKYYGLEALEEIMSVMDSGRVVVIFAGYSEPMKRMIASNEGFCRRVTKFFYFNNFTTMELAEILRLKMNSQDESSLLYGFKLHPSCTIEAVSELIERETTEKQRKEMNGGLVDPMLVNARENLDRRLDFDCTGADSLITITLEDLEAGIQLLSQQGNAH